MIVNTRAALLVLLTGAVVLTGCSASTVAPDENSTQTDISTPTGSVNGTLEVHFINVGQSVSTLVVSPAGETMLIDSGHYHHDGKYVLQYLQRHNVTRIDHFVTSHNDADHIGGNAAIIEYYETEADGIGAVYDPGIAASTQTYDEYLDAIEEHNVTLYETRAGDTIPFAGVDVRVLGPPEPYIENEARNENSVVLQLGFGETSFLFTGDAEDDQEAQLVDTYGESLQSTVMKAGHHGSSSSTSGDLLDAVSPQAVAISSGYNSQYGHPSDAVLQRLSERSIPAYWTATHGDTVFVSNGTCVTVKTQRAAPTDPQSLRDAPAIEPGTTDPVRQRAVIHGSGGIKTATPVATDGGTPTSTASESGASIEVTEIHADAEGRDSENLNDEYVTLTNTGDEAVDLSGWSISDEADHTYTVPDGVTLAADASVTLHTGSGTDSETALYWGSNSPIWNNNGDTVLVTDETNSTITRRTY